VEPEGSKRRNGENQKFIANFVMVTGLFGLAAAAIMYSDAASKGDVYLQDSLWIILGAVILGTVSLAIGVYLYMNSNKKHNP
jgi:predicted ABC-type sugar transport system permease subunit